MTRTPIACALVVVFLTHCAASATAAASPEGPDLSELSLEQLLDVQVISASRREEPISTAPATIYVVTAETIAKLGLRDLANVLALVPGVDAIDPHFFLLGSQRGFSGTFSQTLLLVDGREMNNLIAGESFISHQSTGWQKRGTEDSLAAVNAVTAPERETNRCATDPLRTCRGPA